MSNPQSWLPQYHLYFKKKYGIDVGTHDGKDVLVRKPDGNVERIENPITNLELFDAIERIGKALGGKHA